MGNLRVDLGFGKPEAQKTLKVFGWTVASALVVLLIDLLGAVDVPAQYVAYVPLVNTVLYAIKEYVFAQTH
jgi:hypothetical protein